MRAIEFITEVFQPGKTNWEWLRRGSEEANAQFKVGDREYRWDAFTQRANPKKWEIQFRLIRNDTDPDNLDLFGKTNTGSSAQVLATAVDIIRAFLQYYGLDKVEEITFNAKEDSRIGLYAKMIQRLLPDWDLYQKYSKNNGMEYHLTDRRAYDKPDTKIDEEVLDEMPLPADWDPQQMRQQGTSYKSRLAYALERAKKLGAGSSRVAMTIEYQGRPTVLKVAKNQKGLAQNSVEADILSDGYASQMGILIPIIDYDTQNREPSWVHTELAQKANEKQLCSLMKCQSLNDLIRAAQAQLNEYGSRSRAMLNDIIEKNQHFGASEQDADTFLEYVNRLSELKSSFDIELADFGRAANWGLYQGRPVIIDVGFNSNVLNQYY